MDFVASNWYDAKYISYKNVREIAWIVGNMADLVFAPKIKDRDLFFYYFIVSEYQIGSPHSHVYILFNFYLSLVSEALWRYLQAYKRSDKGKCDFFIFIILNYGESDGNNIFYLCDAKG